MWAHCSKCWVLCFLPEVPKAHWQPTTWLRFCPSVLVQGSMGQGVQAQLKLSWMTLCRLQAHLTMTSPKICKVLAATTLTRILLAIRHALTQGNAIHCKRRCLNEGLKLSGARCDLLICRGCSCVMGIHGCFMALTLTCCAYQCGWKALWNRMTPYVGATSSAWRYKWWASSARTSMWQLPHERHWFRLTPDWKHIVGSKSKILPTCQWVHKRTDVIHTVAAMVSAVPIANWGLSCRVVNAIVGSCMSWLVR